MVPGAGLFEIVEMNMSEHAKYHAVNGQWPETIPVLTGPEAVSAAKRLYRFGLKRVWKGKWKLTSGRRYTWPRGGTFYVNPHRENRSEAKAGWQDLVHMMSHYCHSRLHPNHRSHDGRHHFLEKEMVSYVIRSGWLEGKLRHPKVTKEMIHGFSWKGN